jgi:hypothetical protein
MFAFWRDRKLLSNRTDSPPFIYASPFFSDKKTVVRGVKSATGGRCATQLFLPFAEFPWESVYLLICITLPVLIRNICAKSNCLYSEQWQWGGVWRHFIRQANLPDPHVSAKTNIHGRVPLLCRATTVRRLPLTLFQRFCTLPPVAWTPANFSEFSPLTKI